MDEASEIVVPSHSWTTWTSAILGAFVVGLSGLVPLLLLPDTSPVKRFVEPIGISTNRMHGHLSILKSYHLFRTDDITVTHSLIFLRN